MTGGESYVDIGFRESGAVRPVANLILNAQSARPSPHTLFPQLCD